VQSDEHFPLLEAAASLAQDEYPDLDVQQLLGDVDQLLARLQRRLPADAPALQRLRMLNQFFFTDLGFAGNVNNYYDPDNSYLNAVLRTRRGIPIIAGRAVDGAGPGPGACGARAWRFRGTSWSRCCCPRGRW
jgi:regulator of sirC expression with transglutaminase-like and TPR domain